MKEIDGPKVGIEGTVVSWEVVNADGSIADACYKPKHNMILNTGLDFIGTVNSLFECFAYMAVGTGTTALDYTQTGLATETTYGATSRPPASGYSAYDSTTFPAVDADPYVIVHQFGIQTALAKLNGTFTELGFGPTSTKGANLFSRFLITDNLGNPVSVSVSSVQQLRVKYQIAVKFLPIVPAALTTNMVGVSNTFGYTSGWQGLNATNWASQRQAVLYALFGPLGMTAYYNYFYVFSSTTETFTGIAADNPRPTGAVGLPNVNSGGIYSVDAYTPGSYANYLNIGWPVTAANMNIYGLTVGAYASETTLCLFLFDTPITKTDTHSISFKLKFSWGRA